MYKKSVRISSNEGELQIPKKGNVDWCIKKLRLAYSNFGPVVLTILIWNNGLLERGKLWKSMKNVDFHMILPSIKIW
jgi:hypothetical protein